MPDDFAWLFATALGLVFAISVAAKLRTPGHIPSAVRGYGVVPEPLVVPVAIALVAAEAAAAVALVAGWSGPGLLLAAALMATFATATLLKAAKGGRADCGCLGRGVRLRLGRPAAVVNGTLAVAALTAALVGDLDAGGGFVPYLAGLLLAITYWLSMYAISVLETVSRASAEGTPA